MIGGYYLMYKQKNVPDKWTIYRTFLYSIYIS